MVSSSIKSIIIILLFTFYNNCQSQTLDNDYVAIVSVDKMNVFYVGIDNPIRAGITGIPASQITVSIVGCDATITPKESGQYIVHAKSPGKATITLSGKDKNGKLITQTRDFRVKYIPDPIPMVSGKNGGTMGINEWKAQLGVTTECYDFDICDDAKVLSFNMTLIQNDDTLTCTNKGAKFEGFCYELQQRAKPNSIYLIDSIIAIGPGEHFRNLEEMYFKIR